MCKGDDKPIKPQYCTSPNDIPEQINLQVRVNRLLSVVWRVRRAVVRGVMRMVVSSVLLHPLIAFYSMN